MYLGAAAIVVATLLEDVGTGGAGIANDAASLAAALDLARRAGVNLGM